MCQPRFWLGGSVGARRPLLPLASTRSISPLSRPTARSKGLRMSPLSPSSTRRSTPAVATPRAASTRRSTPAVATPRAASTAPLIHVVHLGGAAAPPGGPPPLAASPLWLRVESIQRGRACWAAFQLSGRLRTSCRTARCAHRPLMAPRQRDSLSTSSLRIANERRWLSLKAFFLP